MRDWEPLIGSWSSSGRTVERPGEPAVEIAGTDVYAWGPGRRFVLHTVEVRMGQERVEVHEVIGEPDGDGAVLMRSFDGHGGTALMRASQDPAGAWLFTGPSERARLEVGRDGRSMAAIWERRTDGGTTWEPWMDMSFRRTS
ncbi:hypothetical protein [Pseudonocardia sp. MH-G8]|uniref:hypothetical protein n=1 Tax=Pseudonocardia sp. MH-G8 TaxID=1854588 RepID=UPI000BA186EB|nr:hypothetical protein [Pseudonocardia sp. MH-G8]OZM76018.1 hypothetical protein CFP66_43320 [Pseudonocardia sp. MH-G8]